MLSVDAAARRTPGNAHTLPASTTMNARTRRCADGHDTVWWSTDRRDPEPCWVCGQPGT